MVSLRHSCKSGLREGTIGVLYKECGADTRKANQLHFHAYSTMIDKSPTNMQWYHDHRRVCNNPDNWQPVLQVGDEPVGSIIVEMPSKKTWWKFWE